MTLKKSTTTKTTTKSTKSEADDFLQAPPKRNFFKSLVLNVLKFSVTFGILYFLYTQGSLDLARVKGVLTDPSIFAAAFSIVASTNLGGVVRWYLLLMGQGLKLGFGNVFQLTMIGLFFNTAIPGAVSGDVVKGYFVVKQQPNKRGRIRAFTTLLLDRLLGLSALVFVSFFAMLFNFEKMTSSPALRPLCGFISIMFLGVVLFYVFVLTKSRLSNKIHKHIRKLPLGELFQKFFEAVKAYEHKKHLMLAGLIISVGIHCSIIGATLLLSKSLGGFENVSASQFFFLVPMGMLVTAIPIAPAGIGTGHFAFLWLFKRAGTDAGADLFTAFVTFQLMICLIGGIFYLRYKGKS